jgi:hypothetical protein
MVKLFCILGSLLSQANAFYGPDGAVTVHTVESFQTDVLDGKRVHVIEFFAPVLYCNAKFFTHIDRGCCGSGAARAKWSRRGTAKRRSSCSPKFRLVAWTWTERDSTTQTGTAVRRNVCVSASVSQLVRRLVSCLHRRRSNGGRTRYGVKGMPHIMAFFPGKPDAPVGMQGLGGADSIVNFATKQLEALTAEERTAHDEANAAALAAIPAPEPEDDGGESHLGPRGAGAAPATFHLFAR